MRRSPASSVNRTWPSRRCRGRRPRPRPRARLGADPAELRRQARGRRGAFGAGRRRPPSRRRSRRRGEAPRGEESNRPAQRAQRRDGAAPRTPLGRDRAWLTSQPDITARPMGQVVQLDTAEHEQARARRRQAPAVEDRARPRRRRLHGRRLRDRRPAGARPAGGQPDRQRVRRLRRHERRRLRRQHARQRGHARGDDAGAQQAPAVADQGHGPRARCCGPTTAASPRNAALFPLRLVGVARELAGHLGEVSVMDVRRGLAGGAADRALRRPRDRGLRRARCSPTPTAPTTSGCSSASST